MTSVELFTYADTHRVRAFIINGRRWAVAADICAVLELANPTKSVARVDAVDKAVIRRSDTLTSNQGIWESFAPQVQQVGLVSENGATDLILESRKPEARNFRRWLTHEVWPSIRDTGSYGVAALDLSDPIAAIEAAHAQAGQAIEVAKAERARAERAELETKMLAAAIERDAPLVAKAEAHTANAKAINRQAFAREVQQWGVKQNVSILQEQVYELLRRKGMLIDGHRADRNHATSHAVKSGWAWTDKDITEDGHPTAVTKLNPRGQDIAWKWITSYVAEHGNLIMPPKITGGAA